MYEEHTGILEIPYLAGAAFGPSADIWGTAGGISTIHLEGDTALRVDILGGKLQGTDAVTGIVTEVLHIEAHGAEEV